MSGWDVANLVLAIHKKMMMVAGIGVEIGDRPVDADLA
jgi:hypothetical protein